MLFDKCQNFCGVTVKTEDLKLKKVSNGYIADDEESSSEYCKCYCKNGKYKYNPVIQVNFEKEDCTIEDANLNTTDIFDEEITDKCSENFYKNGTKDYIPDDLEGEIDENLENFADKYNVYCTRDKLSIEKFKLNKFIKENNFNQKSYENDKDINGIKYGSIFGRDLNVVSSNMTNNESLKQPLLFKMNSKITTVQTSVNLETISNGDVERNELSAEEERVRFPTEKGKTLLALLFMLFTLTLSLLSLSVVHDCVPERNIYDPLPDRILSYLPEQPRALDIAEYVIMICTFSVLILIIFHKYRWVIFRRICFLMGILYLYRALTMQVTVLPVPSKQYYCSPKQKHITYVMIIKRMCNLISGLGLSLYGKHTYCGDYIFSGHTVMLTLSYLIIAEYTPKRFRTIHVLYALLGIFGVIMVLVAHGHYTVDVILAYYVTTRLFWSYHHLANDTDWRNRNMSYNYLSREWWMGAFRYFEKNINGPLPCKFNWPLPWPKKLAPFEYS